MGGKFSLTFFTLLSLFLLSFFDVLFLFLSPLQSIPFPYFFSLYPPPLFFSLQSNFEILLSQLLPITPPQTPPSLFFCSQQTLKIILIGTFFFFLWPYFSQDYMIGMILSPLYYLIGGNSHILVLLVVKFSFITTYLLILTDACI